MKIVAIEPSGNLYGSEYALLDVIRGTRSRGVNWSVILPANSPFEALLRSEGIESSALLRRDSHTIGRISKALSYVRSRSELRRRRPDVIYVNQAGVLRAVSAFSRGLGIPIVSQVQTLEDTQRIASRQQEHHAALSYICNSRFIAERAGVPADRLSVLYQPVMKGFAVDHDPPAPPPWNIGLVGRISESKGHYVLLDAARELIHRGRRDLRFTIIGEGLNEHDTRRFSDAVDREGARDWFDLRGYRTDIGKELSGVHFMVIPSLAEPLGRVLLDACIARRPAIVSDSGGLGEFSKALNVGYRFAAGNSQALADEIEAVIAHYATRRSEFSAAADTALQRLAPASYVDSMMQILERVAAGQPASVEWLGDPA